MENIRVNIDKENYSIIRDESKCIKCGACKNTCHELQAVNGYFDNEKVYKPICINCGQCIKVCPTNALSEKKDYQIIDELLKDKNKIFIFQISPSVRVTLGELFNCPTGTNIEGKIIQALRLLGASYVFDTTFGADLTIMEEANELVERLKSNNKLPLITSCCPAWVEFAEIFLPQFIPYLSTTKSPISITSSIIKNYFSKLNNIPKKSFISIAVAPCTAKKSEIKRKNLKDTDFVITTNELYEWLINKNIDVTNLEDSTYDIPIKKGSHSGIIFGHSNGVTKSCLSYVYKLLTNDDIDEKVFDNINNNLNNITEFNLKVGLYNLKTAIVSGTNNALKLFNRIKNENLHYDFIEVMACPNGCISGGGQPKEKNDSTNKKRSNALDQVEFKYYNCYQNKDILKIYNDFLEKPLSNISKNLLHTSFEIRNDELNN